MNPQLPNLPSIEAKVQSLYPAVFQLTTKQFEPLVTIFANGRIELTDKYPVDALAHEFWKNVRDKIVNEEKVGGLIRDLTFLTTFIQSKGVWFSNPAEKIELFAWIGEIERRYGIGK